MIAVLTILRQAYHDEVDIMASTKQLGRAEFVIRHLILFSLIVISLLMFDIVFPAYWFAAYTATGLGTRIAVELLAKQRSFARYLCVLLFYSARMLSFRIMILYLWFYPGETGQFPAICMIMAGILFSVSQSTRIRSYSIAQGLGDSAVLLVIALDFLTMRPLTPETLLAGLCAVGVMIYHATSLREAQINRKAAQELETRIRQSQKMEAVGRLTGGVAHDFNNILTVVMGNLELYPEVDSDDERRDLVNKAHDAAQRASVLTAQLLAFSRQTPLQTQRIETAPFIQGLHAMAERVLPATILLQLSSAPDVWDMQVDKNQLEVALLNLIINARDAMPTGGALQLLADNYDPANDPNRSELQGRFVALDLVDDGEGISDENIERVMEPFFTTKPVGKGSGLGLSMVKGFVEQSGGDLRISSTLGAGTKVCILIPAASDMPDMS